MAHEEPGVPVEAAASLFGAGDESTVDFFSTSFNDDNSKGQSSVRDSDVASNLFEAGPDESATSFYQSVSDDPLQLNPNGVVEGEFNSQTTPDNQVEARANYTSTAYQSQGWQDEYGQWHQYDKQSQYTSTYDYAFQSQSTALHAPPHTEYHSQTPSQTSEQPTGYVAPQQVDYPNSQNLYTPHNTPHEANYASQPNSSPYPAVTDNGKYSQYAYNPYASNFPAPVKSSSVGSGAPAGQSRKDVNAYRPATLNAYDPPVPSRVRSKGRSAFYTAQPPPTANGVHYASTMQSPSSLPPPLPPPPSVVRDEGILTPPTSYSASEQSWSAREVLHDEHIWSHEKADTHDAGFSSYDSEHGDASESASVDIVENLALSQLDPQDVNVVQQSTAVKFTSSTPRLNSGDNVSIPTDACMGPIATLDVPPLQSSPESQFSITSANINQTSFSPPPLTGSPVESSHTPHTTPFTNAHNQFTADQPSYDPYAPNDQSRRNSNTSFTGSIGSSARAASPKQWDPYSPHKPSTHPRKESIASSFQTSYHHGTSETTQFSYEPTSVQQRAQSRQSQHSYDEEYTSRYNYAYEQDLETREGPGRQPSSTVDPDAVGYAHVLTAPTYAPYAPSPSLLGTNDPLGRASARIPVISFGFGGRLVTCFHSAGETASGFDVSLTSRQSTSVQLLTLHEVIPASAIDSSASSYPGPLFSDPGASSISLARTVGVGNANNAKAKKALVLKWLGERVEELSSGVAHLPSGSQERHNAEGRLVLVRLLKAMVDNDGQLSGSPSIEWAVRSALVPRLESQGPPADVISAAEHTLPSYTPSLGDSNEPLLTVYQLRASSLDRLQEFLVRGERRQAYHYALDEKLWAHAMLIASSVDTQAWKEVVKEFLQSELTIKPLPRQLPGLRSDGAALQTNGWESLRVAYSLFAGEGAAAMEELVPTRVITGAKDSLLPPSNVSHITPLSPNFPQPALTSNVPIESLAKWQETAAMITFSQTTGDSAALTALGDYLAANRWFEAAHACYLLSPRTSSLGGVGIPSVRIVLVGCESPNTLRNFNKDLDVTLLSEIVEFALSLSPPKGQDVFGGLPHLQAYKLIRAFHLAEMGHVELANRYCEAIGSTIRASTRGSQLYTPTFIGELKNLSDRLTAAPQMDKTASWITRKMAKPSLDTIGSWLEGRFSKLIVGDGEDSTDTVVNDQSQPSKSAYGPFSHYSTISSTTTSASPSPSPTPYIPDLTSSVSGLPFGHAPAQIDRASSAMDHLRSEARRASPVQRVASASAMTSTFAQAYNPASRYRPTLGGVSGVSESEGSNDTEGQEVSWWGSSSQDTSGPTPTANNFHKVDAAEFGSNFVSLMDDVSPGVTPMAPKSSQSQSQNSYDNEEEDLGFGNSSSKKQKAKLDTTASEEPKEQEANEQPKPASSKPELKPQSSSWLGRWWSRSSEPAQSGPIKAKLGEETSFYYDKELKRWVNKKAGAAETSPTPPAPPPSRPRTASPSPGGLPPKASDVGAPPHARPASAADVSMPPRRPPRVRSNLVPTEDSAPPGSAPPSAMSFEKSQSGPPPSGIGRPKSSASKRNVRSRYVDVFQQQS